MATGYDARGGARKTFASEGSAPVQTNSGLNADSARAGVQGGEAIGGGEGGEFSSAGYRAAGLGAYFEKLMAPELERKKKAAFFKGFVRAQSGAALDELSDHDSPMTKLFGPTGFAEGAQYYHAQDRINQFGQQTLADMDSLKKMTPDELSVYMAEGMEGMMTGDPFADEMIQEGLLKAQAPLIQTVAKARFEWGQQTVLEKQETAANRGASILQQVASANAVLGEKSDTDAVRSELERFMQGMAKPEGMTDENYQGFLYSFMRRSMTEGNFYGVEALMQMGVTDVLSDDQQEKINNLYDRQANKALDFAAASPAMMEKILKIDAGVEFEKLSVNEAVEQYRAINDELSQMTGVATPYFDDGEIRSAGGRVLGVIAQRARREEDREYRARERAEEREAEAEREVGAATAAWATGQVTSAEVMGLKKGTFETIALEEYSNGKIGGIARAYVQSGWSSTAVKSQIQAKARAGLGEKYTKSTDEAYQQWKQLADVNPALANEYFGDLDLPFANFHRMVQGGIGPEVAFRDAFSKVGGYGIQSVPSESRKAYQESMAQIISDRSFSWNNPLKWGNFTLTETSQSEMVRAIGDEFARIKEHSGRPDAQAAAQAMTIAINNGKWEQYEDIGWSNPRPAKNLGQVLGVQPKLAAEIVGRAIDYRLGKIGVDSREGVRVIRSGNNLTLEVLNDDGTTDYATIKEKWLKVFTENVIKEKRDTATRRPKGDVLTTPDAGLVFSL